MAIANLNDPGKQVDNHIAWLSLGVVCVVIFIVVAATVHLGHARPSARPAGRSRTVRHKVANARVTHPPKPGPIFSPLLGGKGGGAFDDHRNDGLLVGFEVSAGRYGPGIFVVRGIRPLFRTPTGIQRGKLHGRSVWQGYIQKTLARPGYAVGGLKVRWGDRVDGFCVVFMRVTGGRLDPADSYTSFWFGGSGGGGPKRLGCDGRPVIGIHGRCGAELDAIGLVQSPAPVRRGKTSTLKRDLH